MNKKKFFMEFILLRLRYNDLNSSAAFSIVFFFFDSSIIDYPWKNSSNRREKKENQ